jgi:hypothetical protein
MTDTPRDRGKMVKPKPGAPAGGYPATPTPPHRRSPMEHERDAAPDLVERVAAKVDRFSLVQDFLAIEVVRHPHGEWVRHKDYAALSAALARREAVIAGLVEALQALRFEVLCTKRSPAGTLRMALARADAALAAAKEATND